MWSDIVDMLSWYRSQKQQPLIGNYGKCLPLGKNESGGDLVSGQLVYVDSLIQPTADTPPLENMQYSPILNLKAPVWHTKIDHVLILHKPIADDQTNFIALPKLLPALGTIVDPSHRYVMVDPANPTRLRTATSGIFGLAGTLEVTVGGDNRLIVDTTRSQPLWRYQITSFFSSGTATADLYGLDGVYFGAITLTDAAGLCSYVASDNQGYCIHVGNKFIPVPYPESYVFIAPSGGVPAATGAAGTYLAGAAYCAKAAVLGAAINDTADMVQVNNVSKTAIPADSLFVAHPINGSWYTGGGGGGASDKPIQRVFCLLGTRSLSTNFAADPRETNAKINGTTLVRLSSDPFNQVLLSGTIIDVPNPQKLTGVTGDGAILEYNETTSSYFLVAVFPAQQRRLWAKVQYNRPNGLAATVACSPVTPIGIGVMPADPFNAEDTFNRAVNAKVDDRLLVEWDFKEEKYYIVEAEHTATRVRCTVNGDQDDTPDPINVTVVTGLDGKTPTITTAENRFKIFYVKDGDELEVLWDTVDGGWYVLQAEAPTDPTPTYVQ